MEIFRQRKLLCIFMLLLSMDLTKADTPIQRKMVGEYVTFPWLNPSEDNFGNALFAPDGKSIIRISKDSKPVYEYPSYEYRTSLLPEGVMLRDLFKSDEGLYKSEDRNNPPMDNTRLFVYTERELRPHILVDNTLFASDSTYTVLQEDIKIIAQQDLHAEITLRFNGDHRNATSCPNAPMCVHHVKTSPVRDFNTNISVSVTVDYGFYHLERNFTVHVNGTWNDITNGYEKYYKVGFWICGLICFILLVLLVWIRYINIWQERDHRNMGNAGHMQLAPIDNGPRQRNIPQTVIEIGQSTSDLQTMISEAKLADDSKLAELRKNFMDRYLKDLVGDESLDDNKWNQFDCFHSGQIWELINLLTENGPPANPIVLDYCIGFAQFCLEKWHDEDKSDIVENVLLVLFNLTKWKRAHKISREYLELLAGFLRSKSQRVSFLSCRYLVLVLFFRLYRNLDNWQEWRANIQEKMFETINDWKLEERCILNTRKRFVDIGTWLGLKDEPVIQYFALWLIEKYLYEEVDIGLLEHDIDFNSFEAVSDPRLALIVDRVKNQYQTALWNLRVSDW